MARTDFNVQTTVRGTGLVATYNAAVAGGQQCLNPTDDIIIHAKNTSGSPVNLTVLCGKTYDGNTLSSLVVVIPATTGDKFIGPFPASLYNQADGKIYFDFSVQAGVTFALIREGLISY